MERGSSKHGARTDEALQAEVAGMMRAGRETRAEEWNSAEPAGEDQPDVDLSPNTGLVGGTPDGLTQEDVAGRAELASHLGKEVWPATSAVLVAKAQDLNAPDRVLDLLQRLPADREFASVGEVWETLTGGHEEHRF